MISGRDILAALAAADEEERDHNTWRGDLAVEVAVLYDHIADYKKRRVFMSGDVVRVKPGFRYTNYPRIGQPCVVVEMLDEPIPNNKDPDDVGFGDKLDMIIGLRHESGIVLMYHVCSKYYEPVPHEDVRMS